MISRLIGTVEIRNFQVVDFINTLLSNEYIVQLNRLNDDETSIAIYTKYNEGEKN